jgi:uncharacterized protein YjiS (DUF1127 family)
LVGLIGSDARKREIDHEHHHCIELGTGPIRSWRRIHRGTVALRPAAGWHPRASGTRNARSRIIGGIQAYRAALAEQRRLRRARSELESLDDRMLKDIGVVRCEIGRVVRYGRDVQFPESMKREA